MKNKLKLKLNAVKIILVLIWIVFVSRLVILQVFDRERYLEAAYNQQNLVIDIQAERGTIYDCNLKVLAEDIDSYSYYVAPERITNKRRTARKLEKLTGRSGWLDKFRKHPRFLWVARKTDRTLELALQKSGIESLNRIIEPKRIYPSGELARSLIGRVDIDISGLSGIEFQYDELLSGKNGKALLKRDGLGKSYLFDEQPLVVPSRGKDLILTLDLDLQQIVEQELIEALKENDAVRGIGIFVKVGTGEILACAVLDSLGKPSSRNRAITDQYEPGSTFKIVTVATALSKRLFEPDSILCVENGRFRIGKKIIRDDHEYDSLTVEDIIVYSSNIGASKVAIELGDQPLYRAIKEAGFVMPLGIDFPGEASGYMQRPVWRPHYLANVSFGHGISATPLQVVSLYGAVASDGILYRPFIGKAVLDADGSRKPVTPRVKIRRVFSEDIAQTVGEFLRQVVVRGTARKANSQIVSIAGKTGTALKLRDDRKGYDRKKARASFVGFFPAEDPAIVGLLLFDEPKCSNYGGETSAPVFKNIAERYYCLPRFMAERIKPAFNEQVSNLDVQHNDPRAEFDKLLVATSCYYEDTQSGRLVPDFRGLTIKQALALASVKEIECEFDGSGIVYTQSSAAGRKYSEGNIVKLKCRSK